MEFHEKGVYQVHMCWTRHTLLKNVCTSPPFILSWVLFRIRKNRESFSVRPHSHGSGQLTNRAVTIQAEGDGSFTYPVRLDQAGLGASLFCYRI